MSPTAKKKHIRSDALGRCPTTTFPCYTLDAQQLLISDHGRAFVPRPPAMLVAMQLGTKGEAHPIVKVPGKSGDAVNGRGRVKRAAALMQQPQDSRQ